MFMSMLVIGTKTTYLSILITFICYLIYLLVYVKLINRKKINFKLKKTIVVLVVFIFFTPLTPVYHNMNYHFKYLKFDNIFDLFKGNDKEKKKSNVIDITPVSQFENIVFYGREQYIKDIKPVFLNNNLKYKLFGMGRYVKNNEVIYSFYQVERDIYDLVFQYGIFGFIIHLIIPIYFFVVILKKLLKSWRSSVSEKIFFIGISIMIGYLVSYMSGHTLLSVSCATYLSFFIANLYCLVIKKEQKEKKNVMFISSVGGHLTQLLELKSIFSDYNYVLVTEKTDVTVKLKDKYKMEYLIYGSRKYLFKYIFIFMFNIIKSLYLIVKYDPDVIVTTGTHTAVPSCYLGWMFDKKIIYIESFAKSKDQTLTGKIVYPIASIFVVQWESMLKFYPKAVYWGGIY